MAKISIVHTPASEGISSPSVAVPTLPLAKRQGALPIDPPPLSSGEVEEFLAFYPETKTGMHSMFRSLSGKTQAMLWRARQLGVLNDDALTTLLSGTGEDLRYGGWGQTHGGHRIAESIIHSTVLVADAIKDECRTADDDWQYWIWFIRQAVIGFGYRGDGVVSAPPVFSVADEIAPVAGVAAYITGARHNDKETSKNRRFMLREYSDKDGRTFVGKGITNQVLAAYVMEHPEVGYRLGKLASQRDLGATAADAETVLRHLAETNDTKAISEGWL